MTPRTTKRTTLPTHRRYASGRAGHCIFLRLRLLARDDLFRGDARSAVCDDLSSCSPLYRSMGSSQCGQRHCDISMSRMSISIISRFFFLVHVTQPSSRLRTSMPCAAAHPSSSMRCQQPQLSALFEFPREVQQMSATHGTKVSHPRFCNRKPASGARLDPLILLPKALPF